MINHTAWIHDRILSSQPKTLRSPFMCALNKSLAAPIISEGWKEITRGLNTHYYQLNKNENHLTSIASTGNTIIAMGTGNPSGDLYFIKEDAIDKENETSSSRFHEIYYTQLQRPIYCLDWSQHHLLVGSNKGVTQLYDTNHLELDLQVNDHLELLGEYHSQHIPNSFYAPFGKCAPNSHIKSVSFNPTYSGDSLSFGTKNHNSLDRSTHFVTTAVSHVEIWDVNYPGNTNVQAFEPDDSPANVAHWSLLSPSLIVTGGEAGHLYVADLRVKEHQGIVWNAPKAHSSAIRDAEFNPFIPYWLASGGDDNMVNIWDLRATCHKPLAKIDGHHAPITSIAWGNTRPEKLATTSRDGTFRIWSLLGSTIPIWDSYYQLVDRDSHRKSQLPQLEQHWWPGTVESKLHLMDDNFGIGDSDLISPEYGKVVPIGAFGIGAWGKLQLGPLYYCDSQKHSKGSVVEVLASKYRPGAFFCATSSGQLCAQLFRPTTRGALDYPHRYDCNKDPLCYTIDNAIHYRHINLANKLIEHLKEMPTEDDEQKRIRDERVKDFYDCLVLLPPIQENDWKIDSIPAQDSKRLWTDTDMWQCALDTFRKDLAYWRTRLAPGCETIFGGLPLDTGELHPRLSSQLMSGIVSNLDSSSTTFPWDQVLFPPSPSFDHAFAQKSQPDIEPSPELETKKNLRRSSTTPNLTKDDLLVTYSDLKSLNERNSSGTVLNAGANWTPLQRAKTAAIPKKSKQISRQPSLSPSTFKSIFRKSSKRSETSLKEQSKSPARRESPLSQQSESPARQTSPLSQQIKSPVRQQSPQNQQEGSNIEREEEEEELQKPPSRQQTPMSICNESPSRQGTPVSQQGIQLARQQPSPSQQNITTTQVKNETQQKQQDTSQSKKRRPFTRRKKKQQQNVSSAQQESQLQSSSQQKVTPVDHEGSIRQPEKSSIGTNANEVDQYASTPGSAAHTTNAASPQQMDIKSIIKYGSFGHPASQNGNQPMSMSASTSNLASSGTTINPSIRGMSSNASIPTQPIATSTSHQSPVLLSDNMVDEPLELGNEESPPVSAATLPPSSSSLTTTKKTDGGDMDRASQVPRQPSAILAPAKSLRRAFTKKLRRKKTRSSSSSSVSSYNTADRDPQHHRQQLQPDVSRSSSRKAV